MERNEAALPLNLRIAIAWAFTIFPGTDAIATGRLSLPVALLFRELCFHRNQNGSSRRSRSNENSNLGPRDLARREDSRLLLEIIHESLGRDTARLHGSLDRRTHTVIAAHVQTRLQSRWRVGLVPGRRR